VCFLSALTKLLQKVAWAHIISIDFRVGNKIRITWLIKSIAIRGAKLEYSPAVDRQITVKEKGPAINAFEIAGPFSKWSLSLGY
jgi:hypothetical protein